MNVSHSAPGPGCSFCHSHSVTLTTLSGSVSSASRGLPARGDNVDRLTVPGSSTLVTVTVTERVSASDPSLAFTVALYEVGPLS